MRYIITLDRLECNYFHLHGNNYILSVLMHNMCIIGIHKIIYASVYRDTPNYTYLYVCAMEINSRNFFYMALYVFDIIYYAEKLVYDM